MKALLLSWLNQEANHEINLGVVPIKELEELCEEDEKPREKLIELLGAHPMEYDLGGVRLPEESLPENDKGEKVFEFPERYGRTREIKIPEDKNGLTLGIKRITLLDREQLQNLTK